MKKLTLLAITLLGMSSINAQNNFTISNGNLPTGKAKDYSKLAMLNPNMINKNANPSVLTTIFSEDFANGLPATWAQVDSAGNGEIWAYTTTGPLNALPPGVLASTTAANGWMMFDDDGYGGATQSLASASIITPSFDCSGKPQVFLTLQEEFLQYLAAEAVIYISIDSITWTAVHNAADSTFLIGGATTNPFAPVIDISSIAGNQPTVYLKFTYRGDFDYWWQIDDIMVYEPTGVDISAYSVNPISTEYTLIPLLQTNNLSLSGSIINYGGSATTAGTALFEAVDSATNAIVFSQTVALPAIGSLATVTVNTTNSLLLPAAATYKVRMTTTIAGDINTLNDVAESNPTQVTDSVYARDNGFPAGYYYNGPGVVDNNMGANFSINSAAQLTSVSIKLDGQAINTNIPIFVTIHTQTPGSAPTTIPIATTDTLIIAPHFIPSAGEWITIPISTFSVNLAPGLYFVGMHQDNANLEISASTSIVTPGTQWITWATIPSPPAVNGWAMIEDFGGPALTFILRPNFGDVTAGINAVTSLTGFDVYPNPTNGIINVSNGNNDGADYTVSAFNTIGQTVYASKSTTAALTTIDLSSQPAGVYHVKVSNNNGSFDKSIVISNK